MVQIGGERVCRGALRFRPPLASPKGRRVALIVLWLGTWALFGVGWAAAPRLQLPDARYLLSGASGEGTFDLRLEGEVASFGPLDAVETRVGRVEEGVLTLPLPEGVLELTLPGIWMDPGTRAFSGTLDGEAVTFQPAAEYAFEAVRQGAFIGVSASYPVFAAPWRRVNERLRAFVRTPVTRALDEGRALSRAGQLSYPWTHEETLSATLYSAEVLSLRGTQFTYTGGAHPNTFYRALTFERTPEGVRERALRDLFREGAPYAGVLLGEVTRQLRARGAAWIQDGSIRLTEADLAVFNLTGRGLEFAFAPYAVGPYAQGAFFVTVPYGLLEDLLHPHFLP